MCSADQIRILNRPDPHAALWEVIRELIFALIAFAFFVLLCLVCGSPPQPLRTEFIITVIHNAVANTENKKYKKWVWDTFNFHPPLWNLSYLSSRWDLFPNLFLSNAAQPSMTKHLNSTWHMIFCSVDGDIKYVLFCSLCACDLLISHALSVWWANG